MINLFMCHFQRLGRIDFGSGL